IPARSEKRVKITYTQVLPMVGNRYRYSYGLLSEMLRLHPLRELALDVKVSSALPLKSVTSPTHSVRADATAHAAHLEFHAAARPPRCVLGVGVAVAGGGPGGWRLPPRRGADGSFLLERPPPDDAGTGRRLVPDGEPLHLLIVADTSASMD